MNIFDLISIILVFVFASYAFFILIKKSDNIEEDEKTSSFERQRKDTEEFYKQR